jgi:hypothetical protein
VSSENNVLEFRHSPPLCGRSTSTNLDGNVNNSQSGYSRSAYFLDAVAAFDGSGPKKAGRPRGKAGCLLQAGREYDKPNATLEEIRSRTEHQDLIRFSEHADLSNPSPRRKGGTE